MYLEILPCFALYTLPLVIAITFSSIFYMLAKEVFEDKKQPPSNGRLKAVKTVVLTF
ncbi:hypothetical protein JCM19047_2381 [Bacillus sp. JCM 19047]|nr:hypothetical protein JCM19047_2381 [Bacillus sp. JCM 19047]